VEEDRGKRAGSEQRMKGAVISSPGSVPTKVASRFDFGRLANTYDRWYETPFGRACDALEKRAVARALPPPSPAARLLDVGSGTGHWSACFARNGYLVTGVDVAPEMVAVARAKSIPHASFQVADAHALPFDDGQFRVTAAITTLEFVRDARAVLREMARCTSSPGVVLVGVLNARAGVNVQRREAGTPPYADARLFTPQEVDALLAPYGDVDIRVTTFVPRPPAAQFLAPLTDPVGRLCGSQRGAFIVARAVR
jgi:SAM-dependent methyltransferase